MSTIDPTLLPALEAIQRALERPKRAVFEVSEQDVAEIAAILNPPQYIERQSEAECYGDAEQDWLAQSSPSGATFR